MPSNERGVLDGDNSSPDIVLPEPSETEKEQDRREKWEDRTGLMLKEYPEIKTGDDFPENETNSMLERAFSSVYDYETAPQAERQTGESRIELERIAKDDLDKIIALNDPKYRNFIDKESEKMKNAPGKWPELEERLNKEAEEWDKKYPIREEP